MTQNAMRTFWSAEEVDEQLLKIMTDIHLDCMEDGLGANGKINYRVGANKPGFIQLADSMLSQGLV